MRHRRAIITAVLAALVVVGATAVLAGGESLPQRYDTNLSGMTESNEAYQAIQDHYAGKLTQEETLDILLRFWGHIPVAGPTALPAPTRVATATAVASPTPTTKPTPTRTPIQAPVVTFTRINTISIQVSWRHNAPNVTGYEARYRPEGGAWTTMGRESSSGTSASGITRGGTFSVGERYEIQVRSLTKNGPSPWASETVVVPAPAPTPTPITSTPSPAPVSDFDFMLSCANRSDGSVSGEKRVGEDLLYDMEAVFINPNRDPWEYGFFAAQSTRVRGGGRSGGFQVILNSYGYWHVRLEYYPLGYRTLTAGNLATHEMPFNHQSGEKNLLTFRFNRAEKRYELFVNGIEAPLDLDFSGAGHYWNHIRPELYDSYSSPTRSHYLLGNGERVSGRVHYEDFCMVPSQ